LTNFGTLKIVFGNFMRFVRNFDPNQTADLSVMVKKFSSRTFFLNFVKLYYFEICDSIFGTRGEDCLSKNFFYHKAFLGPISDSKRLAAFIRGLKTWSSVT
jgi:hypothetical protein